MAGCDGECGRAAFERRDALFEHRLRRVHDARVDVAEGLQPEQRGGVVGVVEDVGGRLVDRRGARAGRRIGLGAGVDGERIEPRSVLGHFSSPMRFVKSVAIFGQPKADCKEENAAQASVFETGRIQRAVF